jgi:hypothetical protein
MEMHEVKPGQIWADYDCRFRDMKNLRLIKVLEIHRHFSPIGSGGYAVVISSYDGGKRFERRSRIRLNRFLPTANGYKLYQEA